MVEKETVRRGYDEITETYAEQRNDDGDDVAVLLDFLDSLDESARLLDAGCGHGTPVLTRTGRIDAVGLDLSRGQLDAAAGNAPTASLTQGDMTHLPFGDGTFDAVTALYSLIHVPEEDHQRTVDEMARVLRPGGRLLLAEGTNEWHGANEDWLSAGAAMAWHIAGPEATRRHLRTAGFDIVEEWEVRSAMEGEDAAWQLFECELEA